MSAPTLRDYFAAQIAAHLAGALSDPEIVARKAYGIADALLAARAQAQATASLEDALRASVEVTKCREPANDGGAA